MNNLMTDVERLVRELQTNSFFVQTEPHSKDRIWWARDLLRLEVMEHNFKPLTQRINAVRAATTLILTSIPADCEQVIFDTSEGWFVTSLAYRLSPELRRRGIRLVGLQHGVMETEGWKYRTPMRRIRSRVSRLAVRIFGGTPVGAGFGNSPFDFYVALGPLYAEYINRLGLSSEVAVSFPMLTPLGEFAQHQRVLDGKVERWLFLDQVFEGNDRQVFYTLRKLAEREEVELLYRPHPKDREGQTFPETSSETIVDLLSAPMKQLVISYVSTGLVEAVWMGHEILSIHHPKLNNDMYSFVTNLLPESALHLTDKLTARSRIRKGVFSG